MKRRPRIINLSDPVEYLTHPDAAVHALRLGHSERQSDEPKSEEAQPSKREEKR